MVKKYPMEKEWIGNWKKKNRKKVYDNKWIVVYHDDVENPSGGEGIYGVVHYKHLAIGIVPIDDEGNTWLVGQHRYPQDKFSWEIPEGGGALNVDSLESAARELQEEVGLKAKNYELLLEMDLSNSVSDEVAIIYLASGLKEVPKQPDETEVLEIKKLHFKKAYDMVIKGEIKDAMSVGAILKLACLPKYEYLLI